MIDVRHVSKIHFRGRLEIPALTEITCQIPTGSCTFIVGPSGSGKSTLLYLLGALDRPTAGRILLDGRDVTAMTEREQDEFRRSQIGFVFQSFNLIGNL